MTNKLPEGVRQHNFRANYVEVDAAVNAIRRVTGKPTMGKSEAIRLALRAAREGNPLTGRVA